MPREAEKSMACPRNQEKRRGGGRGEKADEWAGPVGPAKNLELMFSNCGAGEDS